MHINLTGRKAIVTGSSAGIGRATAEGLARAGAAVVVNGRGSARVDEAVRQIRDAVPGSDVSGVAADLSTVEGAEALVAQVPDADILVNVARSSTPDNLSASLPPTLITRCVASRGRRRS